VAAFPHALPIALAGFVLFRFFDIVKPPPIYQIQSLPGGFGVMVDDLVAGLFANVALRLLVVWNPGGLLGV
jgi:phosphatidylglycerophosphatase A